MHTGVLEESRSTVVVLGPDLQLPELLRPGNTAEERPLLLEQPAPAEGGETVATQKGFQSYRLRPQVTCIVQDEMVRLLDLNGGNFYALDTIGTRMVFAALERGSEAMVRALAEDYQVSETQVRADWRSILGDLQKSGLTETVWVRPARPEPPSGISVWWRLALARASFWLLGWERTLRLWRGRSGPRLRPTPGECNRLMATVDALVRRIAGGHPLNPQCKERALVSWSLLRRLGLPARLVMGVALYPFEAHAWTECGGRIVGDDPTRCDSSRRSPFISSTWR